MAIETTYTDARARLAELSTAAVCDREIIVIHRRGAEDGALISADELNGSSPTVAQQCSAIVDGPAAGAAGDGAAAAARRITPRGRAWRGRRKSRRTHQAFFYPAFREDLAWWVKTDRRTALRVLEIVEAVCRDPLSGIGKPEPLRYLAAGAWSCRLTQEHRVVYLVGDDPIDFLQARYHY